MKTQLATLIVASLLATSAIAQPAASSSAPAGAENSPEMAAKKKYAMDRVMKLMRPVWSDDQIGRIMLIGWYSGAAALCDDREIDPDKLAKSLGAILPADFAQQSADRQKFLSDNLMMHVGVTTGMVIGSYYRDVPKLCGEAQQAIAELPADKHLFQMPAATPPK